MEVVCTNIENNQLLGSSPRSTRDRSRKPANHSKAAGFGPSPGKFKPRKFAKTDVVLTKTTTQCRKARLDGNMALSVSASYHNKH
ncbi:hypothetical protein E2C01_033388 [Portunus trituberculatus]|uniref:Uncharacterized protein n=1 Tax=Portunus trituberculatus TaxID=210409 RepID=A0A5B7F3L9_PORTR|nr:hypothetical protein [Portunus trituberculatus]